MAITNIMSARDEIIDVLKDTFPQYEKFIFPLNSDTEIEQNANFSPAIFVRFEGYSVLAESGDSNSTLREITWGVYIVYRDKRGAIYSNDSAGQLMLEIDVALQGFKPTGYFRALSGGKAPAPYPINDQGAVLYPLIFSSKFSLTR